MTRRRRVTIILGSIAVLAGAALLLNPFISTAEAGHKKSAHTIIIEIVEHITDVVEEILDKVNSLSAGGGEGNHTLRWDRVLDSTNGSTEASAEGCNSDRFKCIFPTAAFPAGEAVLDRQTGIVWDRAPHDTRGGMDADAGDLQTWSTARFQCANRVIGGQKGNRLPSYNELASLVDPNNPTGDPDLPPGHPFIGVQSADYWSATTNADAPTFALIVGFGNGVVFTDHKPFTFFVWCARGGHNDGSEY